jgi:hypothetical protein
MKTLNLAVGGGAGTVVKFKRTSAQAAANTRGRSATRVNKILDQFLSLSIDLFLLIRSFSGRAWRKWSYSVIFLAYLMKK